MGSAHITMDTVSSLLLLLSSLAGAEDVVLVTGGITGHSSGWTSTASTEVLGTDCPTPALPSPRSSHITFLTADGLILTCGGRKETSEPDNSCLVLDPASQSWVSHSILPDEERKASGAVTLPSGVYIFGGMYSAQERSSIFLPTGANDWLAGPSLPTDLSTEGPACIVKLSEHRLLLVGAYDSAGDDIGNVVVEYDTQTEAWTRWPDLDPAADGPSCALVGSMLVVTGGFQYDTDTVVATTTVIDIETKESRKAGDMTLARGGHMMAVVKDKLLTFGGSPDEHTITSVVDVWDGKEEWEQYTQNLTMTRTDFGAVSVPVETVCITK